MSADRCRGKGPHRGLNCAPASWKIAVINIAASLESVASKMDGQTATDLWDHICSILRRARLPPPNLQEGERASLKPLSEDNYMIVLPADKGNATVIMDMSHYDKRVRGLLTDPVNQKVKKDPTPGTERKVTQVIRELE